MVAGGYRWLRVDIDGGIWVVVRIWIDEWVVGYGYVNG